MTAKIRPFAGDRKAAEFDRRDADSGTTANASVNDGHVTLAQALKASIKRCEREYGLKNFVELLPPDEDTGRPVDPTTVSKWHTKPRRIPAFVVEALLDLDSEFVGDFLKAVVSRAATPTEVVREMRPEAAREYRDAHARVIQRSLFGDVHPEPKARRR